MWSAILTIAIISTPVDQEGVSGKYIPLISVQWELPVASFLLLGWVSLETLQENLVTDACRWCPVNDNGEPTVNGLDSWMRERLVWQQKGAADTLSSVTSFVALPALSSAYIAVAELRKEQNGHLYPALFVQAESVIFSSVLTQMTKYLTLRRRPYAHLGQSEHAPHGNDNLSFVSGHTSFAFSLATSTSITALKRGYPYARVMSAGFFIAAAVSGYLRIAADKHYFTDVLGGALLGASVGGLNAWFHMREKKNPAFSLNVYLVLHSSGVIMNVRFALF